MLGDISFKLETKTRCCTLRRAKNTPTRSFVSRTVVTDISASTGRNDFYLIYGFGMVSCTVSPLSRFTAHLLPVYREGDCNIAPTL
jgi:hypothetical protein